MLERPLLYILSPTYLLEMRELDESTSIYERAVLEKVPNELIMRQLRYFARTSRALILRLATGERVLGEIVHVGDLEVKVACFDQIRLINLNTIVAIYATK